MQSTQKVSRAHSTRKRKEKKGNPRTLSLTSPEFQEKVTRLDKLMQLAAAPTPKAPPGFVLMKDEKGGTLEQVGREADNAWAGVKRIMELLNVEEKYIDLYSATNVNYTGVLLDLTSTISQGVGRGQRTGDSIKLTRVCVRYVMSDAGNPTNWQVQVGHSKDALPNIADLFALSGATSAYAGMSFDNWYENKANVVQHRDLGICLSNTSRAWTNRDFEVKCDHHVVFGATTTTALSGATWLAAISGLNSLPPVLAYVIRVYFVDN
jgi:hypothetical protein